ncbi:MULTISPECIES: hypothetical protein [Mameliella]|uniref:hypothetical protein n=1 Tax=Mameliella TaxID=1434019 RepID=UPI00105511E2|nr:MULTISPECIES: hypothetical protein [Mameliella]MCR9273253.1 hypothetical protein [Paracoccaceae bacterium]
MDDIHSYSEGGIGADEAAETDPDIVIAGPTYPVPHADAVHLDGAGGRDFGLQFGKVMFKRLWRGEDWHPVEPRRITQHSARVLSCRFHVPEPPLVFDTATVTDPGDYGFVVEDDSGTVAISELRILRDTVVITTSADIGANPRLSYAYYGTAGNGGGPATGCRGNLRDSDPHHRPQRREAVELGRDLQQADPLRERSLTWPP